MNKIRLTDLAEAVGCSVATVSRALHDSPLISRATKTRIFQVARTQGYQLAYDGTDDLPSAQPRLAILIGAPWPGAASPALPYALEPLLGGFVKAAVQSPCNLQISHLPAASGTTLDSVLADIDADGYLVFGSSDLRAALARQFDTGAVKSDARVLFWGEAMSGQGGESIAPDNFAIGAVSVTHLAGAGCGRIAYLGETQGADMARRFMGYVTALNEAGLKFDSDLILSTPEDAVRAAGAFDGLFVADEGLYVAVLERLRDAGLATPADRRVVGYYNAAPAYPMEVVAMDPVEAARRIMARLFGPRLKTEPAAEKLAVTLRGLPRV